MSELSAAIQAMKTDEYGFWKIVSRNDAGWTGAHQAGIYLFKRSIGLGFASPGVRGSMMEKFATLRWFDGTIAECRFIYYGDKSRNEYRITRLGKIIAAGDLVVITRQHKDNYRAFLLTSDKDKAAFQAAISKK